MPARKRPKAPDMFAQAAQRRAARPPHAVGCPHALDQVLDEPMNSGIDLGACPEQRRRDAL